ncbi:lipopolysaccharide biosynthesis protein [Nocardiopsis sp. CNT312]|uniref:lipopolysaccharide biosynthesis protein n=1 Tax=Nocardiopsis sp. CNT312 TaxID=1137268 RepID=UPI00056D5961|nr:polysaccharide biosynthesis C-terminal domain-containing protein [Nocardiopsis sp. CNT312]
MGAHPLVASVTASTDDSGLGRVLRGGVLNMAGAAVSAVLGLALTVTVTRAFSQETAGLLFSATSVFLIAAVVAGAGAPDGLVYFIARLRVHGTAGGTAALLRLAAGPATAVSVAAGGALMVFAEPMARALAVADAALYLRILAVFLPCAVMLDTALAATRAHHVMAATVLVDKVGRPLAQLGLVVAVGLSGSAGLLTLAWAGPYLPAAVLAWFWLGRILSRGAARRPPLGAGDTAEGVTPRTFWGFALPRAVAGIAQMGVQRGGVVLAAFLGGLAEAAVFTASTRIMVGGQFATQAVLSAAQPRFAELAAEEDHTGVRTLYQAGTSWLVCVTWPLYLTGLGCAPLIMALFGPDYATGATALAVVCAGQLTASALGMGDLVLTMSGRTGLNLLNNGLSLAVNLLGCAALIPVLGATGAAVALVAAQAVRKLLPLWQLRHQVRLYPFNGPVMIATGSALCWFASLPLLARATLGEGFAVLAAAVAAGALGHALTVWRLRGHLSPRQCAHIPAM